MKRQLTCINCPRGCRVDVEWDNTDLKSLEGNNCKLAWDYMRGEVFNPRRTVTSTVVVKGGELPLVSVKTDRPVPKSMIFDVMACLSRVTASAPLNIGDVIAENVLGTGVNIVATRRVGACKG